MKKSADFLVPSHSNEGKSLQKSTSTTLRFEALKVPMLIACGFLLGKTIGKDIGAGYQGFGQITGSRIGEWIGFAVGLSVALVVVGLFMTKAEQGTQLRRVLSCVVVTCAFMVSSLLAIAAE